MKQIKPLPRQKVFFRVASWIFRPVLRLLLNYRYEPIPKIDEPFLLLSNHNTDLDCIMIALASNRFLRFVATENVTRMGFVGFLVRRYFDPILHFKGKQGYKTVKSIMANLKGGMSVALFPEGNRSFNGQTCPIPPATSKMAKSCGGALVTFRISGGYFASPRWGKGLRKGKVTGKTVGIYPSSLLKTMTDDEIREVIERDLFVDAYEDRETEGVAYKGKTPALGLESTLFMCPVCRSVGTLSSHDRGLSCGCGFAAEYDDFGYLCEAGGEKHRITELDASQRQEMGRLAAAAPDRRLFGDSILCKTIDQEHMVVDSCETELSAYSDRLEFSGRVVTFDDVEGIAINQRNLLILQIKGEPVHYEFFGPISFNALKYLYLEREKKGSVNGTL